MLRPFAGGLLLDEGGELEFESGAVAKQMGGVVMTADEYGVGADRQGGGCEVPVVETEGGLLMALFEKGATPQGGPVVIAFNEDKMENLPGKSFQKGEGFGDGGSAIHDVAHKDQGARLVVSQKAGEARLEIGITPDRQQGA